MPKLTVAIPTYHRPALLAQAIESVLAQTYRDFELLVVADGSPEDTLAHVRSFTDDRIRLVVNERNLGLFQNWNRCAELATGDYFYIMHDDDLMEPANLGAKVAFLDAHPTVVFVHSAFHRIDEDGAVTEADVHQVDPVDHVLPGEVFIRKSFLTLNTVCCPSVMMRMSAVRAAGPWDPTIDWTSDWEYWFRLAAQGDVGYLCATLFRYRIHRDSESRRFDAPSRAIAAHVNCKRAVYRRLRGRIAHAQECLIAAHRLHARQAIAEAGKALAAGEAGEAAACVQLAQRLAPEADRWIDEAGLSDLLRKSEIRGALPDLVPDPLDRDEVPGAASYVAGRTLPVVVWAERPRDDVDDTLAALAGQSLAPEIVFVAGPGDRPLPASSRIPCWPLTEPEVLVALVEAALATDAEAVCFLRAGTLPGPDWLATQAAAFRNPAVGVTGGPARLSSPPGMDADHDVLETIACARSGGTAMRALARLGAETVSPCAFGIRRTVARAALRLGGEFRVLDLQRAAEDLGLVAAYLPLAAVQLLASAGAIGPASTPARAGRRRLVCAPNWDETAWRELLIRHARGAGGDPAACLVLLAPEGRCDSLAAEVVSLLDAHGLDADQIPDVELTPVGGDPASLRAWAHAAAAVLETGSHAEEPLVTEARATGVPVWREFQEFAPELLPAGPAPEAESLPAVCLVARVARGTTRDTTDPVWKLAQALRRLGHPLIVTVPIDVASLPPNALMRDEVDGIAVIGINRPATNPHAWLGDPDFEQVFGQLLIHEGIDVVHFHHLGTGLSPSLVERAYQLGIPAAITTHPGILGDLEALPVEAAQWRLHYLGRALGACTYLGRRNEVDPAGWSDVYKRLVGELAPPETSARISVVIATYNRPEWLRLCLEGFCRQTLPARDFEIVVVDDASDVDLSALIREVESRVPLVYVRHERNKGLGGARATGTQVAQGDIVLFFDDDDRPSPRLLAEHLRTHAEHPETNAAVLGYTGWAPELCITPVMYHVTQIGKQYFSYPDVRPDTPLEWHYGWGGRTSYKRGLLLEAGGFDERFDLAALEDSELNYRLRRVGFHVYFNPRALSYGMRSLDLEGFCKRWLRQGRALTTFMAKHPDPALEAFFAIRDAGDRADEIFPLMPAMADAIAKLECKSVGDLRATVVQSDKRSQSAEMQLHRYYQLYFEGMRLHGYLEARAALRPTQAGLQTGRHPESEQAILVIAPHLPLFDRSSGGFRLDQIVKLMRAAGHAVTFAAWDGSGATDPRPYVKALRDLGVDVHLVDPERLPETPAGARDLPFAGLPSLLQARRYDVAYAYYYESAERFGETIRSLSPETRLIVDSVDVHFLREFRMATALQDEKALQRAIKTRERELRCYRSADRVIALTEVDRQALLAADPALRVDLVPNIHPIPGASPGWADRRDLVFVGGFAHQPNIDAVVTFCAETWPLIAERLPDANLYLVGSDPPEAVWRLAGERIVVTGYVPDTLAFLQRCRVSIAPLRYGAGMKGKVGEALAAGLPVVGTEVALEGMGLVDREHALVAEGPYQFADAICELYRDESLWRRLAANGRGLVERRFSPGAVAGAIEATLRSAADPREPGAATPEAERGGAFRASLIIPCWNNVDYTRRCLAALADSIPADFSYEVVMVDNGSTDETPRLLGALDGDVQVIRNEHNLGFAKACNQGASAARGEWLVFLNNDTEPTPGWLEEMLALGEAEARVGVVGAKLLYPDGTVQHAGVVFAGISEGKLVVHGDHFDKDIYLDRMPYHIYRKMPGDAPYVNKVRDLQVVTGACLAIRRDLFDAVGGFDDLYWNGYEDVDLCLKVLQQDRKVVYCPTAVLVHHESRTEGRHARDTQNGRMLWDRWWHFVVPDDDRIYREDGFVRTRHREHLTVYTYHEAFARAERAFDSGQYPEALASYLAFLDAEPGHDGARMRAAVLAERLAAYRVGTALKTN